MVSSEAREGSGLFGGEPLSKCGGKTRRFSHRFISLMAVEMLKFICSRCSFFYVLSPHPSGVRTLSRATKVAFKGKGKTNTMLHSLARHGSVSTQACTI